MRSSQLLLWASSYFFFSKMLTYKRAYWGMKITVMHAHPGLQSCNFTFSHRAKGKLGSRFYALSKAVIIFLILHLYAIGP